MRKNQTSMTAIGIAILRGIESEKPAGERLCYDPYPRRFRQRRALQPGPVLRQDRLQRAQRSRRDGIPGRARTPYRRVPPAQSGRGRPTNCHPGRRAGCARLSLRGAQILRVFEVDHPASQASKIAKVRRVFGELPAHVTYVAVDFNTQTLAKRLPECGYDETRRTLFIWQGVTQYLTPEAVDSTLAFIAGHSTRAARSSSITCTRPCWMGRSSTARWPTCAPGAGQAAKRWCLASPKAQ